FLVVPAKAGTTAGLTFFRHSQPNDLAEPRTRAEDRTHLARPELQKDSQRYFAPALWGRESGDGSWTQHALTRRCVAWPTPTKSPASLRSPALRAARSMKAHSAGATSHASSR